MSNYFSITKPRMVMSNLLVAAAAFIYGSHGTIDWQLFILMLGGLGFVIAGGCVFNNYYDAGIDARMERTANRALALGLIDGTRALSFGSALLAVGVVLLSFTNIVALLAALVGAMSYALAYTPLKHTSRMALFVGAIAGATPPVIGYSAAVGQFDAVALMLFIVLYIWQLPHFIAISMYRYNDYVAAGVPLFITQQPSDTERKAARIVFYCTLAALLLFCAALIVQR